MDVKDSISVTLKTIDGKETKDQSAIIMQRRELQAKYL